MFLRIPLDVEGFFVQGVHIFDVLSRSPRGVCWEYPEWYPGGILVEYLGGILVDTLGNIFGGILRHVLGGIPGEILGCIVGCILGTLWGTRPKG